MHNFTVVVAILFTTICSGCVETEIQPANLQPADSQPQPVANDASKVEAAPADIATAKSPPPPEALAETKTALQIAAEAEAKAIANWVPQEFTTQMAERASTVQLVKVTASTQVDERPRIGCGGIHQQCDFEILRSSGERVKSLNIVIDPGGHHPDHFVYSRATELLPGSLQVGNQYWFLFGGDYDLKKHPYSVVAWWPVEQAPAELAALVERDAYHWRPIFHKESGLTFGYETSPDGWDVIVKRDGELVWRQAAAGTPADHEYLGTHYPPVAMYAGPNFDMEPIGELQRPFQPDQEPVYLFYSVSRVELGENNRFELAPGKYRLRVARELTTGKVLAEWALKPEWPADDALAMRQYVRETGKLLVSARYEFLETGGLAVGSTDKSWLRKTLRRYDENEQPTKTELYYHGSVKDEQGQHQHNGWVRVDK